MEEKQIIVPRVISRQEEEDNEAIRRKEALDNAYRSKEGREALRKASSMNGRRKHKMRRQSFRNY